MCSLVDGVQAGAVEDDLQDAGLVVLEGEPFELLLVLLNHGVLFQVNLIDGDVIASHQLEDAISCAG